MLTGLINYRCPQVFHGTRICYDPEWQEELSQLRLDDIANWRSPADVPPLSASDKSTACYRIALFSGRVIYYKRYDYQKSRSGRLGFWMRPSKAGVEYWGFMQYRKIGIEVPNVVGYGESRVMGALTAAFIITEEVANAMSVEQFLAGRMTGLGEAENKKMIEACAGRLIDNLRKAHRVCLFHYDLKWRNILIQKRGDGYYPVFIDCPRSFISRIRRRYGVTTDLSALARKAIWYLTLRQRYRFLAAYLGDSATSRERKYWYRRTQRRLERRAPKPEAYNLSLLEGIRFDGKP